MTGSFESLEQERGERDAVLEAQRDASRIAAHLRLLADAGAILADTLDPDQVLRRLTELAVPALADACEVVLVDARGSVRRFVGADGVDPDRIRRRERTPITITAEHPIAVVLRTGRPLRLDARRGDANGAFGSADDDTTSASFGINEAVIVPMRVRGEVIGAFGLGVGPSGRHLGDDVIDVATVLGSRAAVCFDNARMFSRQRAIADTLQRSLVPTELPRPGWLELAGRYWVPESGVEVGGDFYDALEQPGSVTLLIGDVCGKGIEAASLTALARHTLRTALVHVGDPVIALRWLHEGFRAQAPNSFVTAAIVRLAPGPGGSVRAAVTVGGHPRPIIVRAGGTTEVVEAAGTAPGLPIHRAAPIVGLDLHPGDAVVLYTDGVTDVAGDGALTTDGFRGLVSDCAGASADEIATEISARLEQVRPRRERTDDVALLIARVPS